MYSRPPYDVQDPTRLLALIAEHPFATLVGQVAGVIEVTVVPLLAHVHAGTTSLVGHVAAGNPLARATEVTAIFQGPHAYISASWYAADNLVPTWNYQVVEARGKLQVMDGDDQAVHLLQDLAVHLEGTDAATWQQRLAPDVATSLRRGIVCFRIAVSHLQGVWKLSQHHPPERRQRVIDALRARAMGDDRQVADAMEQALRAPLV